MNGPYVSRIDESRQFEETEHLEAVLEVHIQFDISHLQVVHQFGAVPAEGTGSECTGLPSAHGVGASGKIAFDERHGIGIEVRHRHTQAEVRHQTVLRVDDAVVGEVDITFGVLGKGNLPHHVHPGIVLLETCRCAQRVQGITGSLGAEAELHVGLIGVTLAIIRVVGGVTPIEDELVFVTGAQYRRLAEELLDELVGHPRHVQIIDVDEVELVCPVRSGSARDIIGQSGIGDRTGIFIGSLLVVI